MLQYKIKNLIFMILIILRFTQAENILMITMGGTKSHKIPFWELARGLIKRYRNIFLQN